MSDGTQLVGEYARVQQGLWPGRGSLKTKDIDFKFVANGQSMID